MRASSAPLAMPAATVIRMTGRHDSVRSLRRNSKRRMGYRPPGAGAIRTGGRLLPRLRRFRRADAKLLSSFGEKLLEVDAHLVRIERQQRAAGLEMLDEYFAQRVG